MCIREDYNKTADVSATQLTAACGIIVLWLAAFLLFYLTVFDHDIRNVRLQVGRGCQLARN